MLNVKQILEVARSSNDRKWADAVAFLKNYDGEEDDLIGAKIFLENHGFSKDALISFAGDIESATLLPVKNRLIRIPAWSMVAAASIILAAGLYFNNYVQQKSLHIVEDALPVYLSDDDALFNKAMSLYKKGEYGKASFLFRQIETDTAYYYTAVSYEMLQFFNLSKDAFNKIEPGSEFYNKAQIRLAAIYIDAGQEKKAAKIIRNLKPENAEESERIRSVKVRLK